MSRSISEEEEILAADYVLGTLDPSEVAAFESVLVNDRDLQAAVYTLQATFNKLPSGLPAVTPPPSLKARVMESLAVEAAAASRAAPHPAPEVQVSPKAGLFLMLPKVLAGLGLLFGAWLAADNFRLRQQLQFAQQVNQQELANILNRPKSRLVSLVSQENQGVGNILFTPGNWQQVIVSAQNLPPLPIDHVYHMWLELANGEVIPCGEFKTNNYGAVFIKLNAKKNPPKGVKAKGVFVTIDRLTDPLQPTGQRVIQGAI